MKTARNLFSFLLVGLLALSLTMPVGVQADQLQNLIITLSDARAGQSNNHTFAFDHPSAATLREVEFEYCQAPSGACEIPPGLITSTAIKGTLSGLTAAEWSLNASTNGLPRLRHVGAGEAVAGGASLSLQLTTITNSTINGTTDCEEDGDESSDTCYVRVNTYSDLGNTLVDESIGSYTVVSAVTVRARVDPLFTFVVEGVAADEVNNGITTSVASTYNELDFGNLTAEEPAYAAHSLAVTTNTENGYTINSRMITQMTGVYTTNNIDPFISTWSAPTTWTEPTGTTPNDNTGWIGANTTDTDVPNWSSAVRLFGPVSSTARTVMQAGGSDDGSSPVYVTYGIEANVFQPADTYTGTLIYTALPTY